MIDCKERDTVGIYRDNFAEQLAALAGAECVYMGFFDCHGRTSIQSWIGYGPQSQSDRKMQDLVRIGEDIGRILTRIKHDLPCAMTHPEGADRLFEIKHILSDGDLVGIGANQDHVIPVMMIRGKNVRHDAIQNGFLKIGMSYLTQQIKEAIARSATPRDMALESVLNALSTHVAVVDKFGELSYSTDMSPAWLKAYGSFEITLRRFSAKRQGLQKRLHEALALATGPQRQSSILPIDTVSPISRMAVVMPLENSFPPKALIILQQENDDPVLRDHLLKLMGLTRSECKIAHLLLEGKSLNEAAAETNLSLSTVRSYLKGIFAKTRTHRQGEFITSFNNAVPRVKYIPPQGGDEIVKR